MNGHSDTFWTRRRHGDARLYAFEDRSHWAILAFALESLYGFLQGAWPFGLVEAIWAAVAIRRWTGRVRVAA